MSAAAAFSSRYFLRFVPGIGTKSSPLASTHAKASWPGFYAFAISDGSYAIYQDLILVEIFAGEARVTLGAGIVDRRDRSV